MIKHLAAQNIGDCEIEDRNFVPCFENSNHNCALFQEHRERKEHRGDISFRVDLSKFLDTLHVEISLTSCMRLRGFFILSPRLCQLTNIN